MKEVDGGWNEVYGTYGLPRIIRREKDDWIFSRREEEILWKIQENKA